MRNYLTRFQFISFIVMVVTFLIFAVFSVGFQCSKILRNELFRTTRSIIINCSDLTINDVGILFATSKTTVSVGSIPNKNASDVIYFESDYDREDILIHYNCNEGNYVVNIGMVDRHDNSQTIVIINNGKSCIIIPGELNIGPNEVIKVVNADFQK